MDKIVLTKVTADLKPVPKSLQVNGVRIFTLVDHHRRKTVINPDIRCAWVSFWQNKLRPWTIYVDWSLKVNGSAPVGSCQVFAEDLMIVRLKSSDIVSPECAVGGVVFFGAVSSPAHKRLRLTGDAVTRGAACVSVA